LRGPPRRIASAARDAIDDKSADFMIGDPALPGYLLEALEAFDDSCPR